jgi:acetyl esterase
MSFLIELQRSTAKGMLRLPHPVLRALVGREIRSPEGFVLDPQVQAIVRLSQVLGHSEWASLGLEKARRAMTASSQILQARPRGSLSIFEASVPVQGGAIPVRIYRPADQFESSAPLPVVVYYHGGGFVLGSLRSHDGECRAMALGAGALVVAVDYRLAPEHTFPTAVDDGVAAYLWAVQNAHLYGGDPKKMAVAGDSAGGNIAAVVARDLRHHEHKPVFQLLIYPAVDFTRSLPSHRHFAAGLFLTKSSIDWFMQNYVPDQAHLTHPRASPLLAGDHAGVAPALVVTAGFDPLRDEGDAYAAALRAAGVPTQHRCYEGQVHGFFSMSAGIDSARAAFDEMIASLRAALTS